MPRLGWFVQKMQCALALLFLSAPLPAAAQVNMEAVRMVEVFFDRCVEPLMQGQPLITDGLNPLPEETARSMNKHSDGRAWMTPGVYVSLGSIMGAKGRVGCMVQNEKGFFRKPEVADQFIIQQFEKWVDKRIEAGTFRNWYACGTHDTDYMRVVESIDESPVTLRLVLSSKPEINYIFMIAAEIREGDSDPTGCS